ncbi:MAG: HAMP domain-containing histidine kinase [Anaerolineae bacterium]|nr:HAMP domain-containing histidine kinase [Anaerolineae bacterium]
MLRDVTEGVARDAMRSEILDMIVHDLRSPLNSILGSLYLMQAMLEDGTSAHELQAVLQEAKGAAATMMQLIESMLDVKKLKHGRMALNLSAVSLHDVAAKACEIMEVLAREANLTLETAIDWDIPLVLADATALQRVLVNLLDNAIRYTPEGGRIRLAACLKGEQVEVSVTDAGPGIPPEMRARVFEKYVQAHWPSLRGRGTAGLGLAFCRLVVQEQGGDIWAMEGPEGGAAIVFTVPVDPEACMAPASPE